jgi:hypothetical protein
MNKEIELTEKCPDCQVSIGERHEDGCDVTRCRHTGKQMLTCFNVVLDKNGKLDFSKDTSHECEPCIWTGEWPGEKVCRDNNWYTYVVGIGDMEDLNSVPFRAKWNPELEDWEAK